MRLPPPLSLLVLILATAPGGATPRSAHDGADGDGCSPAGSQALLPPGFVQDALPHSFEQAVGLSFDPSGRLYVWEKRGVVRIVEGGVLLPEPLIDLSAEVANEGNSGLLGFARHPEFERNGIVHLLYTVAHEGLAYGRITRYRAEAATGYTTIDPTSRVVILGEDHESGIPICFPEHGLGSLFYGEDGSLLATAGDGHSTLAGDVDCLAAGLLRPKDNVGPFRAQLVDSMNGKILRLDPFTGDGWPDNPFYDPDAPRAPRSRVWALGFRQPFRASLRPGSGGGSSPGVVVVGEAGSYLREEVDVVVGAGRNFGWPIYEGFEPHPFWSAIFLPNLDAPNPLFAHSPCPNPYFFFQDLLVEDTLGVPAWLNPCDPVHEQVPAFLPRFLHARPAVAWAHDGGPAKVPGFDAAGNAVAIPLGTPGAPVAGESFTGFCSIGGTWYTADGFPPEYEGTYFQSDFQSGWIKNFVFDEQHQLTEVRPFALAAGFVVSMAVDPLSGALYFITQGLFDEGGDRIQRIRYEPGNAPPTAAASASVDFGPAPLEVRFSAQGSSDPEGDALAYHWDFGSDQPPSLVADPVRTFPVEDVTAQGTIVAKILSLSPPVPMGDGSKDPEVIRDGVYPPVGSLDTLQQYDTYHTAPTGFPDKGDDDWIGYTFAAPRELVGVLFQEGLHFAQVGGWFDSLAVQVHDPQLDAWVFPAGLELSPAYPGSLVPSVAPAGFESYELSFDPVVADGVRLFGPAGGTFDFVSVAELRVLALPSAPPTGPEAHAVRLTVSDSLGSSACDELTVFVGAVPPEVTITSPPPSLAYPAASGATLALDAQVSSPQHPASELACVWEVLLHHNSHVHPEEPLTTCAASAQLFPHAVDPGDLLYYELRLTVTDPLGLATVRSAYAWPDDDCDLDGFPDALQIAADPGLDLDGDGVLDACRLDCNGDGLHDLLELAVGVAQDKNANSIPDGCERAISVWKKH